MGPRLALAVVALVLGGTTCTLLLNRDTAQCKTTADCASFPGHDICSHSVCIASGLQPDDCFAGAPDADVQFFNQCTVNWLPGPEPAKCLSFDNCKRFGLCNDGGVDDAGLTPPPTPDAATPVPAADGGSAPPTNLPNCKDPSAGRGSVVYISGSSNFVGLLEKLAPIITSQPTTSGLVPVFRQTDSCTGARSMYLDNPTRAADHFIRDPAAGSTVYAQYFDAQGGHNCLLGSAGAEVDIGEAEIAAETCGLHSPDPASVRHIPGPILPILFVVPIESKQDAISAEAARQVLGSGANGKVDPWVDPKVLFIRAPGTATARLIGLAINLKVPDNRFWGVDPGSARNLDANLKVFKDTEAQAALGLLGSDTYDSDRLPLKALAFKATGEECAFLPDSQLFTYDKINVRDGHYPIWGRLHFFAAVSPDTGSFTSPAASAFMNLFSQSPLAPELLDAFIGASWIPECAMQVERDTEMGPLLTNRPPPYPCGCHFDSLTGMRAQPHVKVPDDCVPCTPETASTDCTDPKRPVCNFQFCEARTQAQPQ